MPNLTDALEHILDKNANMACDSCFRYHKWVWRAKARGNLWGFFFSLFDSVSIEPISNVISDYTASHCCSFQVSIIKLLNSLWRRKWKWTWGDKIAYFIIIITALVNSIVDVFFLKMLWICTKRSKLTFNMTSKLKRIREGYQCN